MTIALIASIAAIAGPNIIFIGNSHTSNGNVTGTVQQMLLGEETFAGVQARYFPVGLLTGWQSSPGLVEAIKEGGIDFAVLQGAEISSSHQYTYSQAEAINLAKRLKSGGAKVLLVSEWPRRGWDETEYIENVYRQIAAESGASVIPVGRVWDAVRNELGGIDLWQPDGNHANPMGSYLSARTIAWYLGGRQLDYVPAGVSAKFAEAVDRAIAGLQPGSVESAGD